MLDSCESCWYLRHTVFLFCTYEHTYAKRFLYMLLSGSYRGSAVGAVCAGILMRLRAECLCGHFE